MATYLTCSRSRIRRGSGNASTPLSIKLERERFSGPFGFGGRGVEGCSVCSGVLNGSAALTTNLASFAVKASSTRWASGAVSLFFSGSDRCAQIAASSAQPRWLSSATRLSRNSADVSGPSAGESDFERTFASRRMVRGAGLCRRQEFSRPRSFPVCFSIPDVLEVGFARSGASRSSSPAIPTSVNKA